ncbi:uncharacterized protein LTR77_001016 [Saxophila tyrrhenica]|uniref:Pentatricopeptide repeat-containing protein-mitochondrial domain-containing protein n=1 Tax=Saxophila tyrrhenica TaxID=1690608 RepID=A0AAV9PPY6_9PEZI|nr:hypothetical protein LTR77_001016 [Saxophila tyrrhenica]
MNASRLAIDPLWQCICPSWTTSTSRAAARLVTRPRRPTFQCLQAPRSARRKTDAEIQRYQNIGASTPDRYVPVLNPIATSAPERLTEEHHPRKQKSKTRKAEEQLSETSIDWRNESTLAIYDHMRGIAIDGNVKLCRYLATILVRERREPPNIQLYNMLILSNVGHEDGMGFRVGELIADMEKDGIQPDSGTCHAGLKVLAVHPDHITRADILEYMTKNWIQLSEDGAHDVAAGLFREGLFEQALLRLDMMRADEMLISPWLLDMAVYILCEANEVQEAYRIMRQRVDSSEINISRSLWMFFLDKASENRHHPGTALAWKAQVEQHFINPASGICLNVLATSAQAADAEMATDVFTHLSKRSATFQPIHYELLISTYLATDPPDLPRALTILTIMALEKVEPTPSETRALFLYMRDKPHTPPEAITVFRELHRQGRKIPIAALNVIIESYVEQGNLADAMKLYKQIHTFAPLSGGAQKSFANIETFNLLLKGCRNAEPPDEQQASFLVSELLALRVPPTALTYDRLILLFMRAGLHHLRTAAETEPPDRSSKLRARGLELLEWSYRHFTEMRPLGWLPRFGTLENLSVALAGVGDWRCWDVLQVAEDEGEKINGWEEKGGAVRRNVEGAWAEAQGKGESGDKSEEVEEGVYGVGRLGERAAAAA